VGRYLVKIKSNKIINFLEGWKAVRKVYKHFPAENMLSSIEGSFFNHLDANFLPTI
jgi:hypothetical protein